MSELIVRIHGIHFDGSLRSGIGNWNWNWLPRGICGIDIAMMTRCSIDIVASQQNHEWREYSLPSSKARFKSLVFKPENHSRLGNLWNVDFYVVGGDHVLEIYLIFVAGCFSNRFSSIIQTHLTGPGRQGIHGGRGIACCICVVGLRRQALLCFYYGGIKTSRLLEPTLWNPSKQPARQDRHPSHAEQ